jgi:lipopolysaccharide export LptBFGC system permease protein LptF
VSLLRNEVLARHRRMMFWRRLSLWFLFVVFAIVSAALFLLAWLREM